MKIAWFRNNITPEVGCLVAGYGPHDVSVAKLDDLFVTGLCIDDGTNKVVLISFDLLGLDESYIMEIRRECAALLNIPDTAVLLSCTHTHSGPETRSLARCPENLNKPYLEKLKKSVLDSIASMHDFKECIAVFNSVYCDSNNSRRQNSPDNHNTYLPFCRELTPLAVNNFADKELGVIAFLDPETQRPIYVIGNYAAHPLSGHGAGVSALRISADFPGVFRNYVTTETGAEAMFISGAAGDMIPKDDEGGAEAIRRNGTTLGVCTIRAIIDSQRALARYKLDDKVGSCSRRFTVPVRRAYSDNPQKLPAPYSGSKEVSLEIQCVSIGDICFTGVPGELCAEVGQEIKWHSPFCRTFIAYNSTAYFSYICPGNFLVSGGYEASAQRLTSRGALTLLNTAVDTMYELHETVYPSPAEKGENYPDYLSHDLVYWHKK